MLFPYIHCANVNVLPFLHRKSMHWSQILIVFNNEDKPAKLPLSTKHPHLIHDSFAPLESHAKQHLHRFSRFCTIHHNDQQTDQQTGRVTKPVSIVDSRPHSLLQLVWDQPIPVPVLFVRGKMMTSNARGRIGLKLYWLSVYTRSIHHSRHIAFNCSLIELLTFPTRYVDNECVKAVSTATARTYYTQLTKKKQKNRLVRPASLPSNCIFCLCFFLYFLFLMVNFITPASKNLMDQSSP